jgi:hypothetical protein
MYDANRKRNAKPCVPLFGMVRGIVKLIGNYPEK